jgi:hypothetical protein
MTVCWSCSYPSPGIKNVNQLDPAGVCRNCYSLTCDWHGAVDSAKGQFWCAACLPGVIIRAVSTGGGGGGGPGGQPVGRDGDDDSDQRLLGGRIKSLVSLSLRFPELAAASRDHAGPIEPVAYMVEILAELRWTRLTGQQLDIPRGFVAPLVGLSLWAAGHEASDIPNYPPGEEGPLLRRNPLVSGLLYAQRLEQTSELFQLGLDRGHRDEEHVRSRHVDEELHRDLRDEVERLAHLEVPRRVIYQYEEGRRDSGDSTEFEA